MPMLKKEEVNKMASNIIIDVERTGYAPYQCGRTMTVNELIEFLENNCDGDEEIYIGHDRRYTFSAIREGDFDLDYEEDEDEESEED